MLYARVDKARPAKSSTERAQKLKVESDNCVAIAIGERDSHVAALLIDEAAKLARRARELTASPDRGQPLRKFPYPGPKQP